MVRAYVYDNEVSNRTAIVTSAISLTSSALNVVNE